MPQYRTKQITFDAVQIPKPGAEFVDPAADLTWVLDAALAGAVRRTETGVSVTLADQGLQSGSPGDWLMKAADGTVFICPASEFGGHYEAAPVAEGAS